MFILVTAIAQGAGIRLTAEILYNSFTRAVSNGSHVDCTGPFCLLQWNLSWVKDKCVLSYFMASFVINSVLFSWPLLVASRYEDLIQSCREDGSSTKTLETRSQPPGKNEWNLDIRRDACSNFYCGMYLTQQQLHWMSFIFQSIFNSVSCHVTVDLYWLSVQRNVSLGCPYRNDQADCNISLW